MLAMPQVPILIVDDHPDGLLALSSMLARPDYHIETARSGAEALKKILGQEFAVVLLDVLMPDMDGFETARLIRKREASRDVPILFLTAGGAEVGMIYRAYSVGAVDYLAKPVDPDIVRAKVGVFVDLYRKTQRIRHQEELLREADRRKSQQALRESESLYQATFEDAAVGIAHAALDGRWLRVNQRFCDILGYTRDEVIRMRFQQLTHPDDLPTKVGALHQMIAGELATYRREERYLRKDGSVVWVQLMISLLKDAVGQPNRFIMVMEDITEAKRAEERQRFLTAASERLLSSLDDRSTLADVAQLAVPTLADWCILYEVDSDGAWREHTFASAGSTKTERVREAARNLVEKPGGQAVLAEGPHLFSDLTTASNAEIQALRWLGVRSAVMVPLMARGLTFGSICLLSGNPDRKYASADLGMVEDLAHRVALAIESARLYREAQQAVQIRDEFLSVASHELRTPLTPLDLTFQWLLGKLANGRGEGLGRQELELALGRCRRQVDRLTALIDNLLDVSRLSAGQLRLHVEDVDLRGLVEDVADRFREELDKAACKLSIRGEACVRGKWDRLRLEQVVTNLLGNAIKYGAGKPIEVSVESSESCARMRIQDHGVGIDPDKIARIFGRFERAASRSYGGLGLGLYIVRQLVEAHGGEISVVSQPGAGSRFTVELPLVLAARAPGFLRLAGGAPS